MHENRPSRAELIPAALIALSLLSLLAPLPRPRAVSESPWLVEFASMLALAGVLIFYQIRDKDFLGRLTAIDDATTKWIVRLIALFTLWSLLSALWAHIPYLAVHHALLWGEYILFFLLFRDRFLADGNYKLASQTFAIVAALLGILCIIEYATLPDFTALEGVIRLRYGAYAELLVTILPVLAALAICARERRGRVLFSLAAGLGWLAVMLSLSKGAFIAGIVGFVVAFAGIVFFADVTTRRRALAACAIWLAVTISVQAAFSLLSPIPSTVDYISGKADPTRSTALARVFVWKIGAQMAAVHPIVGVGADNFGVAFNDARADYRKRNADNPSDEPVSDNLVERGHNELLQVTAELGVVGLLLFALPFAWFGWQFIRSYRNDRKELSPVVWAAIGGMAAFLVSSMVSSFSFRLAENGIAFFIVLALAAGELSRTEARSSQRSRGLATAFIAAFFALSLAVLATKGYAEHLVFEAGREADIDKAAALYDRAVRLDPAYATAYLQKAGRYYGAGDFAQAAVGIRHAIDGGCGVVITYSALAASQEKAGDTAAAEATFNEAFSIYPRSVFLHVRYAILLESLGRANDFEAQITTARQIDRRQADGWYNLFKIGSVRAFYAARENAEVAAPAELLPEAAVLEYLDKPPVEPPQ